MTFFNKDAYVQTKSEAMTRKVLAHHGNLMAVEVHFHKASDDPGLHSHPHEQIAYVLKGSFEFIVGGKSAGVLEAGDSIYFEPDIVHGGKPLEDGSVLLDVFNPQRKDFL
jgi:quercetin dioxygenase-like cupin family protein